MIHGMDVSHNNGIVNWEKAKEEGIEFAFIRAMFGYNKDKQFDRNWSEAKRVGIARGAYSWIIHGFDPIKTAKLAVDCISHDLGELPPVVDFENTKYYGKPTFAELKKYINEIEKLSGVIPIIYTSQGYWNGQPNHLNQTWVLKHDLWVANYTTSLKPAMPSVWANSNKPYVFWQYTERGDGHFYGCEGTNLDLNRFNGNKELFESYLKGEIIVPPQSEYRKVTTKWLSFRSRPELYEGDRPAIGEDVVVKVLEIVTTDIKWYYVELSGKDKGYISTRSDLTKAV